MYDGGKIIIGLIIGIGLFLSPFFYNAGSSAKPPDPAVDGEGKGSQSVRGTDPLHEGIPFYHAG
jgi:hypothetical protein